MRWVPRVVLFLLVPGVGGCAGIAVQKAETAGILAAWKASIAQEDTLSPRTLQTLHRWDLDALYQESPLDAASRLHGLAVQARQPDMVFALAEVYYVLGRKAEKHKSADACAYYYLCAGYAYHYLFDEAPTPSGGVAEVDNHFDPRFRLACDLYNTGLAKCIRAAQRVGRLDPRQQLQLPTPDGRGFTLSVRHHGFAWPPDELGELRFSADYAVVGLANHYRTYGLGVPLIGTRVAAAAPSRQALYPRDVSFPVTAFFRFEGTIAELGESRAGRLELYNPLAERVVAVRGRSIPLETDLTTPLAYFLANTDLQGIEYVGFLRGDALRERTGIYMFEPYQPGKIPVLMVHGLLSSPLTWAPLFNDLRADPVLRQQYQFWFYLYPTGTPYLTTAADLRGSLARLRAELDPGHCDPALDNMVCIGHSMGGLVSKLLTVESRDDFWRLVSADPFVGLKGTAEDRRELEQVFFFDPQPFVTRVVFLGTPHHGSKLSPSPLVRFADRFVHAPQTMVQALGEVARANPNVKINLRADRFPSSVDLLAPGASALELLAARPKPPGIHFHSVIGDAPDSSSLRRLGAWLGEEAERSDGIVPYASAHLEGVDSEVVVAADHMAVHQHPLAVLEVRRILLQHLKDVREGATTDAEVIRVGDGPLQPSPVPEAGATERGVPR